MLAPTKVIRENSRIALKKDYLHYIAVSIMLLLTTVFTVLAVEIFSEIAGDVFAVLVLLLLLIFLVFPVFLGILRFFWRCQFNANDTVSDAFYYFASVSVFFRAAKLSLLLALKTALIAAVCFAPTIFAQILCNPEFYELIGVQFPDFATNLWFTRGCLSAAGTIAFLFTGLRYYLAPFLLVVDENIIPSEAIEISRIISKRTRSDYIGLVFSLSGWIILSFIGIPLIFTVPYFIMAYIVHSRFAVAQYNAAAGLYNKPGYAVGC